MTVNSQPTPLKKLRLFLTTYVLTLQRFDLFLQGSLLALVLLGANVTLLLKRDAAAGHAPANIHDWVAVGAAGLEFGLGALIAWWGQARRHLALSVWLAAAAAAGLLVLAFPYEGTVEPPADLCGGQATFTPQRDPMATPRLVTLVLAAGLCALGRLSVMAHGLTYLDDHEPENGPYFYGILISIRLSLGLNGETWLSPASTRDSWWLPHLSLCILTLIFAALFTLFPHQMQKYKQVDDELMDKGFLATLGRVVRNKTVLLQGAALSLLSAAVFSFIRFDDDYVQAVFHIETSRRDPRTSRATTDIFRSLVIIFFISIFRTRFSVRRADGVKAGTAARVGGAAAMLAALPFGAIALLRCGARGAGGEPDWPGCSGAQYCGCDPVINGFSPVCDLNTSLTFFSPCYAGCRSYEDLNGFQLFTECACGGRAARGACSLPGCLTAFNVYQVMFAVMLAFAGAALLMQGMVVLRCVPAADKTVAVGASFSLIALLSHAPGHLVYMLISRLTCMFNYNNTCLLHYSSLWSMAALSASLSVVSGLLSLLASRY